MYVINCSSTNLRKSQCLKILEKKEEFCVSLSKYGVLLKQYEARLATPPRKRRGDDIAPPLRQSPELHGNADHEQLGNRADMSKNLFGN